MKLLMHVCCGPCTIYPLTALRDQGVHVEGIFFNPNIHPYREFKQRLAALDALCAKMDFRTEIVREYGLKEFLRQIVYHEDKRCAICYKMRLSLTARHAKRVKADAFTTTLLYSRYQKHELIVKTARDCEKHYDIPFYYQDFRDGWQQGIDIAIDMDLYRQPYCGCIYSEQERYDKKYQK